jgi:prepilin-type N-terminal cleavage/methylation domain-containing protein
MPLLSFFKKTVQGFSLIEVSLVLVIIGVLMGAALKGKTLLDSAKINSTSIEFLHLQSACQLYGKSSELLEDPHLVWEKLASVGLLPSADKPMSRLGGVFTIQNNSETVFLRLGGGAEGNQAFLTGLQAKALLLKMKEHGQEAYLKKSASENPITGAIEKNARYLIEIPLLP